VERVEKNAGALAALYIGPVVEKTGGWLMEGHTYSWPVSRMSPFTIPRPVYGETETPAVKQAGPAEDMGNSIDVTPKSLFQKTFEPGNPEQAVSDAWLKLDDPSHLADIQRVRAQVQLRDLMQDDVIGSHDPEEVFKAYNDIAASAPRLARQTGPMRALLRRHLQRHVEPFEAKELLDMEKSVKDTESPNTRIMSDARNSIL
jgi:hypothetical protein